jgi:hypothetical protein
MCLVRRFSNTTTIESRSRKLYVQEPSNINVLKIFLKVKLPEYNHLTPLTNKIFELPPFSGIKTICAVFNSRARSLITLGWKLNEMNRGNNNDPQNFRYTIHFAVYLLISPFTLLFNGRTGSSGNNWTTRFSHNGATDDKDWNISNFVPAVSLETRRFLEKYELVFVPEQTLFVSITH